MPHEEAYEPAEDAESAAAVAASASCFISAGATPTSAASMRRCNCAGVTANVPDEMERQ